MINPLNALAYAGYLWLEIMKGGTQVARDMVTPGLAVSPAIVELPLRCTTDLEVSILASSITITPGTITLGIAPAVGDRPPTLFVHALYGQDRDELLAGLRDMERRLLTMTRGSADADPPGEPVKS